MANEISIGGKIVKRDGQPFIIAEAGVNHETDLQIAMKMVEAAARAGADAIKFQTYKAEKLAVKESPAYWQTERTQREFFSRYDAFGPEEYYKLAEHCKRQNILFMSTPFDLESVEFLDPVLPCFKVASADITCFPLLEAVAKKQKPILLSTGASDIAEIYQAIKYIEEIGNRQIILLHCVLNYPNSYETANLNTIKYLQNVFPKNIIGYSDHTVPDELMLVLTTAYQLGAIVLEKHFTLDKKLPGNDHYHAMDEKDLINLRKNIQLTQKILGSAVKKILPGEELARNLARRSLVAKVNIPKGQVISKEMLTFKRPGTGIPPSQINTIIGRIAQRNIQEDEILQWDAV